MQPFPEVVGPGDAGAQNLFVGCKPELEGEIFDTKITILSNAGNSALEIPVACEGVMGGLPDMIFVLDTNKEHLAVAEAKVLGIPVVAVIDSNSDPDSITFPVPGNDDALRAIDLYCDLLADAVLEGLQVEVTASGADLGEAEEAPVETVVAEEEAAAEGSDEAAA